MNATLDHGQAVGPDCRSVSAGRRTCLATGWRSGDVTNVAEIAPAVAVLGRPLRPLRIPVDEWAVAIALAMRAFPTLVEEFRILHAARRLRPKQVRARTCGSWALDIVDLMAAAITVALRRADEIGDAIAARGGTGQISAAPSRPKPLDWPALSVVAVLCAAAVGSELALGSTVTH